MENYTSGHCSVKDYEVNLQVLLEVLALEGRQVQRAADRRPGKPGRYLHRV